MTRSFEIEVRELDRKYTPVKPRSINEKVVEELVKSLSKNIEDLDKLIQSLKRVIKYLIRQYGLIQIFTTLTMAETWWYALKIMYETGVDPELNIKWLTLWTYVDADSLVEYDWHLYAINKCCLCTWFQIWSEDLGQYARMTVILNEDVSRLIRGYPVAEKWKPEWDNKVVIKDKRLTTQPERLIFALVPKARLHIIKYNDHSSSGGYIIFECPYTEYRLDYGINMVLAVWEILATCIREAFHVPEFMRELRVDLCTVIKDLKEVQKILGDGSV